MRYEYKVTDGNEDSWEKSLNELGEEGWELVFIDTNALLNKVFYFKRPLKPNKEELDRVFIDHADRVFKNL